MIVRSAADPGGISRIGRKGVYYCVTKFRHASDSICVDGSWFERFIVVDNC